MVRPNEQAPVKQFTLKERTFIAAYVKTKNGTQAAIAAGYSERSARTMGSELLAKPNIKAEIERRIEALCDRYEISADKIVRELASMAFGSVDDFVAIQDDGSVSVDFSTATKRQLRSLQSIETEEETRLGEDDKGGAFRVRKVKFKLAEKRAALMDLAKIARMLPADRHEHSGPGGGPIAFDVDVREEHKIDIEAMAPEERDQLRELLLTAVRASKAS